MHHRLLWLITCVLLTLPLRSEQYPQALAQETFLAVWQKVDESFYDRSFNGIDWKKLRQEYEAKVANVHSLQELRSTLNEMLGRLGRSHFAVFGNNIEENVGHGGYLGLELRISAEKLIIFEVSPDSPAQKAGLKPGMEILQVGDQLVTEILKRHAIHKDAKGGIIHKALEEITTIAATPKKGITTLKIKGRKKNVRLRPSYYKGEWGSLGQGQDFPVEFKSKLLTESAKIRLIDFNLFVPSIMPRLVQAIAQANSENADGLIIDLRGNPGGLGIMATGLAGRLISQELDLGDMNNPSGNFPFHAFAQENSYLGPLVILVDSMSASTSEIFTAALQEHHRAHIIGRPTMGAVLPSIVDKLPNGDRFQYAIGDFVTALNKVHLEGRGVIPDQIVALDAQTLRKDQDPDLNSAIRWIAQQKTLKNDR